MTAVKRAIRRRAALLLLRVPATVARNLNARKACQHIGQARGTAALDGLAIHDGHIGHQIGQGCSVRVAVTTVSCGEGMRAFSASSTGSAVTPPALRGRTPKSGQQAREGRRHSTAIRRARGVRFL